MSYSMYGVTPRLLWRGLEGYVPAIGSNAIPGGGPQVVILNYVGRGVLVGWGNNVNVCNVKVWQDGVLRINATLSNISVLSLIGFDTSIRVDMLSGGIAGNGWAMYNHE